MLHPSPPSLLRGRHFPSSSPPFFSLRTLPSPPAPSPEPHLQARRALAVDGVHGHRLRDAGKERRDARLVRALRAGAEHAADDNVANVGSLDARLLEHAL
eukprot:364988-Chlamydomonas_euryale.AAC.39